MSQDHRPDVDPALLRGLTVPRLTRRAAFRGVGVAALSALLAACDPKDRSRSVPPPAAASRAGGFWDRQTLAGTLNFANWPAYIDTDPVDGKTSLQRFTDATGIKVRYREVIQDNDSFLREILPALRAGRDTGWDLMVLTNGGSLEKLIRQGFLQELDLSRMPNFNRFAAPEFKSPSYDPGNRHSVAWQAGIIGIAYNPGLTGRQITSFEDLFDSRFKGRVGMLGDSVDLPNFTMVGMGINPETSTEDDWRRAADRLRQQRDRGIVRGYVDNVLEIRGLESGSLWLSMAYSGDVLQANTWLQKTGKGAEIKFVVPREGAMLWTDNMCIPLRARHPLDALTYMDFVYQPSIAAQLAEFIRYVTPVQDAAKREMQRQIPTAAPDRRKALEVSVEDPMIFPSPSDLARTHRYRVLTDDEEKVWNRIFEPIVQA
ncbi:MAG TPA: spermidine/putrescine ABC transporter substrate-binding protein [Actinomycetes bacterium]|nr:spermidine/putrescine ABC transporter substrate-binding protein [Actinomycetes bacterium]